MKHKTAIITFALLLLTVGLKAQDYYGVVKDEQNGAIPYANIGIKSILHTHKG